MAGAAKDRRALDDEHPGLVLGPNVMVPSSSGTALARLVRGTGAGEAGPLMTRVRT